jgi:beta-galactosidase
MQDDPRVGYELPLRLLVWSDGAATTIGYRSPGELGERYELEPHAEVLTRMRSLLEQLIAEAVDAA